MKKFKFTSSFGSKVRCLPDENEANKCLSKASLDELQNVIPSKVLKRGQEDLLPIASNLAVINMANKNGDAIDGNTVLQIHDSLVNKYINIEHDRKMGAYGHIVSTAFSKFNTEYASGLGSEIISIAKDTKKPFNLSYAGVLYKVLNPKLIELVVEANDPTSESFLSIGSSWEIGFSIYNIAIGGQTLDEAEIITPDDKRFGELDKILSANDGSGKKDGEFVYRVISGEGEEEPMFLGGALTNIPAAAVAGVIAVESEGEDEDVEEIRAIDVEIKPDVTEVKKIASEVFEERFEAAAHSKQKTEEKDEKVDENDQLESNANEKSVNLDNQIKEESIVMKIESVKDIKEDLFKEESVASKVTGFIEEQIKNYSEKYAELEQKREAEEQEAQAAREKAGKDLKETQEKVDALTKELDDLKAEAAVKEAEAKFNARMSAISDTYELSEEAQARVANDIRELDDEAFAKWEESFKLYAHNLSKEAKAEADAQEKERLESQASEKEEEPKEEESQEEVVGEAIATAAKETAAKEPDQVPNSASTEVPTLKDQFAEAFNEDEWDIKKY
jgi:hypothetical protein